MTLSNVELVEVSPRDGLQNEAATLATADKIALIRRAVTAGVRRIEVASFVSPRRVPQMADAEAVVAGLGTCDAVTIGLVLNRRGAERALATAVDEIGAVASASDGFGIANQGRSSLESVEDAIAILALAGKAGRRAQVTISTAFGCPFDGAVSPAWVAAIARRLADAGATEIALADTIGVAAPADVARVMRAVRSEVRDVPLRLHFHDTRGRAVANARAALDEGAATLDGSIGGIGGCPFAPGASGNVATEDLLAMLESGGIATGVDRAAVTATARWLGERLGRPLAPRLTASAAAPPA